MEKLDKILRQRVKKDAMRKPLEGAEICFYANTWGNGRLTPISFCDGILKVSVTSSPAASELQCQEPELIDFINQKLHQKAVKRVRIIISNKVPKMES